MSVAASIISAGLLGMTIGWFMDNKRGAHIYHASLGIIAVAVLLIILGVV